MIGFSGMGPSFCVRGQGQQQLEWPAEELPLGSLPVQSVALRVLLSGPCEGT